MSDTPGDPNNDFTPSNNFTPSDLNPNDPNPAPLENVPPLERLFGARDVRRGAPVVIEGRTPPEVLWFADRADVEGVLTDYMRRHGLPTALWAEWFSVVEADLAEAARISQALRTGAKP